MQLVGIIVGPSNVVPLNPLGGSMKVTNAGSSTLYYSDNNQVSTASSQGTISAGSNATFTNLIWAIAAAPTAVTLQIVDGDTLAPWNWPWRQ